MNSGSSSSNFDTPRAVRLPRMERTAEMTPRRAAMTARPSRSGPTTAPCTSDIVASARFDAPANSRSRTLDLHRGEARRPLQVVGHAREPLDEGLDLALPLSPRACRPASPAAARRRGARYGRPPSPAVAAAIRPRNTSLTPAPSPGRPGRPHGPRSTADASVSRWCFRNSRVFCALSRASRPASPGLLAPGRREQQGDDGPDQRPRVKATSTPPAPFPRSSAWPLLLSSGFNTRLAVRPAARRFRNHPLQGSPEVRSPRPASRRS